MLVGSSQMTKSCDKRNETLVSILPQAGDEPPLWDQSPSLKENVYLHSCFEAYFVIVEKIVK